jgi:hypothetical protein
VYLRGDDSAIDTPFHRFIRSDFVITAMINTPLRPPTLFDASKHNRIQLAVHTHSHTRIDQQHVSSSTHVFSQEEHSSVVSSDLQSQLVLERHSSFALTLMNDKETNLCYSMPMLQNHHPSTTKIAALNRSRSKSCRQILSVS